MDDPGAPKPIPGRLKCEFQGLVVEKTTHGELGHMPQPQSGPHRDTPEHAEEAALRREAAELLRRSRWYRDECCRELLLERRWFGVPSPPSEHGPRSRSAS
jgi:hypothetical protein